MLTSSARDLLRTRFWFFGDASLAEIGRAVT
jgi:hypothetical protein